MLYGKLITLAENRCQTAMAGRMPLATVGYWKWLAKAVGICRRWKLMESGAAGDGVQAEVGVLLPVVSTIAHGDALR